MTTVIRTVLATFLVVAAGFALPGSDARASSQLATARDAPYNVVVIVLDTSESFQRPWRAVGLAGKIPAHEALRLVQRFLEEAAAQRRRRTEGRDQYFLVAADAASQLIWSGSRDQLARLTPEHLTARLAIRKQFAACTDLEGALNEAARILRDHPSAEKWVLAFSDLLHEPPRGSYASCAPASGMPPAGIRWDDLGQARLGFYFVSKDFPHRPDEKWRAALEGQSLSAVFLDAAQAMSADVSLTPPPAARYRPTQEQVQQAGGRLRTVTDGLRMLAWLTAGGFGLAVLLVMGLIVARRSAARRREVAR